MAKTTTKKASPSVKATKKNEVEVKSISDLTSAINRFIQRNLHDRFGVRLSEGSRTQIVAYGPWLATAVILLALPQLLILAQTGNLVSLGGFFNTIFFNKDSWALLLVMLINLLLLVDGLSHVFNKLHRGWNRIYSATLLTTGYVLWQLIDNSQQRAAVILSAILCFVLLFIILDVREYYK